MEKNIIFKIYIILMDPSNDKFYKKYLIYKIKYLNLKKKNTNFVGSRQSGGGNKIDVILFKATWCGHCTQFLPVWNTLQKNFNNKFNFITFDSDENKNEMKQWDINGFPTILFRKDNKGLQYDGPRDYESMNEALTSLLN
jgi:thiol-disulfide isomerase/thioredoxin